MNKFLIILILFQGALIAQKNKIPAICECINMEQSKLTPECEKIKQEWKQEFEAAAPHQKEEMIAEYEECKRLGKMETEPSVCLCATIDPKLWNKKCKKLKKQWDKAYHKAGPEQKKDMKQEILDCGTKKPVKISKEDDRLSQISDDNFCDCMDYYGGKKKLELENEPDLKKIEQYDKINKSKKNKCLFVMKDIQIGTIETIDRAENCERLAKYFRDSTHIYYDQLKAKEGIYQILEKYQNQIDVCSCMEIMKLEKSILEKKGTNINRRKAIQLTFERPRQFCAKLIEGMGEEELKVLEQTTKNCP